MKKRTEEHGEITKRNGENDKEAETTEDGESERDGLGDRRETGVVWGYGEVFLGDRLQLLPRSHILSRKL